MIDVRIDKLVYGGDGLGRIEGRAVLVPLVLPGERVTAEIVKEEPRLIRARVKEIVEASPQRQAAPCPYFGRCGGCHYQHASYEDQLRFKAGILTETLRRLGKFDPPEPEIMRCEPWNYRNRTQLKGEKRRGDFRLGYYELASHRLLPVDVCPISSPRINELIPVLWKLGRRPDFPEGGVDLEVVTAHGDSPVLITATSAVPWPETLIGAFRENIPDLASLGVREAPGKPARVYGRGSIVYRAGEFEYRLSHGSFFQVNRSLVDTFASAATEGLEGETALDLFSGVGYFALPLARLFRQVIAVEANPVAVHDLDSNRNRAGLTNVQTIEASAQEFLERPGLNKAPDVILLDPPRAGLGKRHSELLARMKARRLVYVSCDPSTLARDAAVLLAKGYRLEALKLVDLFPQTFHIEAVGIMNYEL